MAQRSNLRLAAVALLRWLAQRLDSFNGPGLRRALSLLSPTPNTATAMRCIQYTGWRSLRIDWIQRFLDQSSTLPASFRLRVCSRNAAIERPPPPKKH
jgi:hypothetical protein